MWPALPYSEWQDTCTTLHLWTQIVGKIRLSLTPWINHSWQATLYVTSRGLTTGPIPCGERSFQLDFDFLHHLLQIRESRGGLRSIELRTRTVADFYATLMARLAELHLQVSISTKPNELPEAVPFDHDRTHSTYEPDPVQRFWRILELSERVFTQFRSSFLGKVSPVHFFWGGFDLAVTRFSGRRAPLHAGGIPNLPDRITQEAYSHEVSSAGFWPGNAALTYPAYYSYAYPEPDGYRSAPVQPEGAIYNTELGEFLLPYDVVRTAPDPERALLSFLDSTYRAAADAGQWDCAALECAPGLPRVPRVP